MSEVARPVMHSRDFTKFYQDRIKNFILENNAPLAPLEDIPFKNTSDEDLQGIASNPNDPNASDALNEIGLRKIKQKRAEKEIKKGDHKYYKENLDKILASVYEVLKIQC